MTHPTKAICPVLLEDFRKIALERKDRQMSFTSENIRDCMKKVTAINLLESVFLADDFEIKAYYAGHVLGAAMFYIRVGTESLVYTGDYNMSPDRHLGAAWIDPVKPTVLITESTYATTIRDSKRARERDFLKRVHDCVSNGGKVLIPTFAVGRAQELFILLESYLDRSQLDVPVYFSAGLTEKANKYYRLFINWTNERLRKTFHAKNAFDFSRIKPFNRTMLDMPGPMILFSSPGMLHSGFSLEAFKAWGGDAKNLLVIPGYCAPGTIGAKVLSGQRKIDIDRSTTLHVEMRVESLSFSAHADAKGILQLISQCEPQNVVLVHGEKPKMTFLKDQIQTECKIPCYTPANGESLSIQSKEQVFIKISTDAIKRKQEVQEFGAPFSGVLLKDDDDYSIVPPNDASLSTSRKMGKFLFGTFLDVHLVDWDSIVLAHASIAESLDNSQFTIENVCNFMYQRLILQFPKASLTTNSKQGEIHFSSIKIKLILHSDVLIKADIEWEYFVRPYFYLLFRITMLLRLFCNVCKSSNFHSVNRPILKTQVFQYLLF